MKFWEKLKQNYNTSWQITLFWRFLLIIYKAMFFYLFMDNNFAFISLKNKIYNSNYILYVIFCHVCHFIKLGWYQNKIYCPVFLWRKKLIILHISDIANLHTCIVEFSCCYYKKRFCGFDAWRKTYLKILAIFSKSFLIIQVIIL